MDTWIGKEGGREKWGGKERGERRMRNFVPQNECS